jgi:ATP-dependent helicase/DNAse subunit B
VIESIREAGSEHLWEEPEEVQARDLARGVMDAILEDSVVLRDRRLNCVNVIDAQEARQWDSLRVVFVAGLLEKEFPVYPREDVFLRDLERKRLNENTDLTLKENLRQRDEERYLFYVAATRARDLLYLCHPAHDVDGKDLQPSFYVDDLMDLFTDREDLVRRASLADPCPPPEEASSAADLEVAVARALGRTPEPMEEALYRTAPDPGIYPVGMRYLRWGGDPIESGDLRAAILESTASLSASGVNRFLRCPRLYFVRNTVGPRSPGLSLEEQLGYPEIGSIAHRVLERRLRKGSRASLEDLIEEEIRARLEGVDLGLERDVVVRNLRTDLLWALSRQAETPGPFRPWKFEHPFRDVEIPAGDHPVSLRGTIDRIDAGEVEGRRYAVLVDYKLSRGFLAEQRTAVLEPTDVQLPVYALAVRRTLEIPVAGAEFFPIRKPGRGGIYRKDLSDALQGRWESKESLLVSPEEFEEILERAEETIGDAVRRIREGEVGRTPLDPSECTEAGCEAFHVCRPDRWALMEGRGT